MRSLSIIGLGRAGGALSLALKDDLDIRTLVFRDSPPAVIENVFGSDRFITWQNLSSIDTDILIISTPDQEIRSSADKIATFKNLPSVALHLSGSLSSDELSALRVRGVSVGSMHPLVSLSDPVRGSKNFADAYFCLEGDEIALEAANEIVGVLGGRPFTIDTSLKPFYHASAVMASGHLTALLDSAFEMLTECGLSLEKAREILFPLIDSTIANLRDQPGERALTGPFARGDLDAFHRHLASFEGKLDPKIRDVYLALAARSVDLARRADHRRERLDELSKAISVAKENAE